MLPPILVIWVLMGWKPSLKYKSLEDQASLEAQASGNGPLVVGTLGILYFRPFPNTRLDLPWCLQKVSGVRTWWRPLAQLLQPQPMLTEAAIPARRSLGTQQLTGHFRSPRA